MKIAITGGLGAGKSTVIECLKEHFPDANFYSMDVIVSEMYNDYEWCQWLSLKFGTCEKVEISKLVFSNHIVKAQVESKSKEYIWKRLSAYLIEDGMTFIEVPMLFEFNLETEFDLSILVTANDDLRIVRSMNRDGKSREEILKIMNSQMPEDVKKFIANIVVDTGLKNARVCALQIIEKLGEMK